MVMMGAAAGGLLKKGGSVLGKHLAKRLTLKQKDKAKHRRVHGMHLRKGRLFMGFTQKEVKDAMRARYAPKARRRK